MIRVRNDGTVAFTILPQEDGKVPFVWKILVSFAALVAVGEAFAENPLAGSFMALGLAFAGFAGRHFIQRVAALEKNAALQSEATVKLHNKFDRFARGMFILLATEDNKTKVNELMNDVFET